MNHKLLRRAWRGVVDLRSRLTRVVLESAAVVAVLAAALLLFAKVGEDVFEHESGTFDAAIEHWTLAHRTPIGIRFFTLVSAGGGVAPVVSIAIAIMLWLWIARGRRVAAVVVASATVATVLFLGLKVAFSRTRPLGAAAMRHVTYSFPSGHATVTSAVFATLAFVLWSERLPGRRVTLWAATLAILLVGVSRVYLDVHWATDVLGGWCLGLGVAAANIALYQRWRVRHPLDAKA